MKIPLLGPDLEQAIEHTLKLTFLHNFIPIALALACLGSLIYLIAHPSRLRVFLLIGFSLLLLHFEYVKHIMEPLSNQTLLTLNTDSPNYKFQWFIAKMISRGIPFLLLVGGWGSLAGSAWYIIKRRKHVRKDQE